MRRADIWRRARRFACIGVLNTGVDWGVFFALAHGLRWPLWICQASAYAAGVANSYVWNRRFTFAAGRFRPSEPLRFVSVNVCSLALSAAGLAWLTHEKWPWYAAKAAVTVLTLAVNFAGSQWWVFRPAPSAGTPRRGWS
ncbi:putative membrane protein YngA [Alicyclobacillus cellulosilyticus]|uniref:Membrane protein YngA n=1 Tax=Alicyclobacillus cellulosilyticus TaxID=1003997 RepID=A0A917NLA3_9BACL|nr:GtrA family protein [Alicyclobacillus cellulosilyticus]GGJ09756.1 putative membrane protein YngA [Alicyclobacillus cellulosilyticus]